jgi:predicted RNA binding protein YcfA (HicA-like mRNA interferase family)
VKIVSGKRMCRVLEQRGWTLARVHGSHHVYRHTATARESSCPPTATSTSTRKLSGEFCATPG